MSARTETDLRRLLSKCEIMRREMATNPNWRLPKYIDTAQEFLQQLERNGTKHDSIIEYRRRIDFLRKLVETEKETPMERMVAVQMIPHSIHSSSENIIKEIHQKTASTYAKQIRDELFQSEKAEGELRYRKDGKSTGDDLDTQLRNHNATQERVSDEILRLARALKEQAQSTNQILAKDVETLGKSGTQMDKNQGKLREEALILAEYNRRACKCWLLVILVVVFTVFIYMVLFMKFMKKRI